MIKNKEIIRKVAEALCKADGRKRIKNWDVMTAETLVQIVLDEMNGVSK